MLKKICSTCNQEKSTDAFVAIILVWGQLFETNNADQNLIIQSVSGHLLVNGEVTETGGTDGRA